MKDYPFAVVQILNVQLKGLYLDKPTFADLIFLGFRDLFYGLESFIH